MYDGFIWSISYFKHSHLDRSGSGRGSGLSRLARRLSQKERRTTEERRRALRQRSVSLDCGDGRHSMNGCLLEPPDQDDKSLSIPASPSLPTKLSKNSSSPNLTGRLSRKSSASKNRKSTAETLDGSMSRDKKKRSALDLSVEKNYKLRMTKVRNLIEDVERRVGEMKCQIMNMSTNSSSYGGSQYKELKRQLGYWEFKHKLLKRMITGLENAKCPEEPTNVTLSVISSSSLLISFDEPISHNGAVVTGYKAGEHLIEDPLSRSYCITDLTHGTPYYVRIRAWNVKGYGEAAISSPPCAVPSSWREIDNSVPRSQGKLQLLNDLFINMRNCRPADASEIKDSHTPISSPLHPRKSNMRKSIKNLFSSAPKFQKSFKRGVYLACVICNEDRILVTAEDTLPILEVDESFSTSTLNSDFHWLMKVACTWEDVKSLRQDMDKSSSSGSIQFRCKLLQVVGQLQSALGIQDLGRLYYQPYKDSTGSVVLVIVNTIKDPKCISTTHVKWMAYSKVQKKTSGTEGYGTPEVLLNSVPALPRGLYIGYLKLKSSVDMIRIMVPEKTPNVLPYTQIKDLPNVTKEEWEWLRCLSRNEIRCPPTPAQLAFQNDVANSCKKLLKQLGISEDQAVSHRFYDIEVIEMSSDVSFLLLLPPAENVCSVPGHHEEITQLPNYTMLPVQVFEMIHMMMYQNEFISRYTRLSSILEMDVHLAQQAHREAFSSEELNIAKERLDQLAGFQQKLDEAWKGMRWTMDIITHARDKNVRGGLPLSVLYAPPPSPSDSPSAERKDLGTVASSSNSDVASSTCSDCGYHSDISSVDCHANKESCHCGTGYEESEVWTRHVAQPGVLRVYAAYETGLARGTSVKLHVTPRTTSREVIDLVVQQLNKAVLCKGLEGPVYGDEQLSEFCLVAVIGARERVLRDDYQPLQLQNPWTSGRLYVRLKNNLLAAIEQGQVTTV
ncbi:hypothetical protein LSH36_467g04058 [Paralvinella palmiformis]|uniref:Fibronectin type-III domain-containing protein n=1 Tax=Paralvinella palmiformis TaxID=53620 RepID=A0AAD9MZ63_9ANNE|nr:hypothetical protein LSH36_467g04058 [Paralvinella palmiformis]